MTLVLRNRRLMMRHRRLVVSHHDLVSRRHDLVVGHHGRMMRRHRLVASHHGPVDARPARRLLVDALVVLASDIVQQYPDVAGSPGRRDARRRPRCP